MKTLVGCGAAAGIAAAFNAPVAGALFAVEIILMDYAVASFSPIIISSVMATVISHTFEGDFPALEITGDHFLHSPYDIGFYLVLGIMAGVVSYIFIKWVFFYIDIWNKVLKIPPYWKTPIGGVFIGLVAIFFPQIMGVGYDSINLALNHESMGYMGLGSDSINAILGNQAFWMVTLALVFIKIFATGMTLGSGGSGGIFAPSLFVGAMLGAAFGHFAHEMFPAATATPGTYALIAMGGLVAGTTRAPITAILTIFELTKETSIILPLMITCIISTIVSSKFSRESIYTLKLLKRNINIRGHAEINVMKTMHVKDLCKYEFVSIPENANFSEVVSKLIGFELPYLSVHDIREKRFRGIVSIHDIKDVVFEKEALRDLCIAGDIANREIPRAFPDDNCSVVLSHMRHCGYDCLPVMAADNHDRQVGIIWLKDIVTAYDKEIEQIDLTSGLADKIAMSNLESDIRFLDGYVITEIRAPRKFVGRTLKELQIRSRYGVDVLTIKQTTKNRHHIDAIPHADHRIKAGETLVLAGKTENINQLKFMD